MTNPYEPARTEGLDRSTAAQPRCHTFAGLWLSVAGVLHFVAINMTSGTFALDTLDWSAAAFLVILGFLVLFQFRIAMMVTRLLGSFTVIGLILAAVLSLAGFGGGGELTYGAMAIVDPAPWQIEAMLGIVPLTFLPPWYALQRMFTDNHAMPRSGGRVFSDG